MSIQGFHDVRFPTDIGFGSSGGPEFSTEVTSMVNGTEQRNSLWEQCKPRYDVAYGIKTFDDLYSVYDFFQARRGKAYSFRFMDRLDYGTGSWSNNIFVPNWETATLLDGGSIGIYFQTVKTYGVSPNISTRVITKPSTPYRVKLNGVELPHILETFEVDYETGIVTFIEVTPVPGVDVVTFQCNFDVPVRFDTDFLSLNLSDYLAGRISVPLLGVNI